MKMDDVGESQHPTPHVVPSGLGWALHHITQQGRRQKRFSTWHALQPLDGLREDAACGGQRLIS